MTYVYDVWVWRHALERTTAQPNEYDIEL